jgi:hypothetical protein
MSDHKTVRIVIKEADVDVEMVPVVNWLNSFHSVTTQFCCQGNDKAKHKREDGKRLDPPYVLFTCWDRQDLMQILWAIRHYYPMTCEVTWDDDEMPIRYKLDFMNRKTLKEFIGEFLA